MTESEFRYDSADEIVSNYVFVFVKLSNVFGCLTFTDRGRYFQSIYYVGSVCKFMYLYFFMM